MPQRLSAPFDVGDNVSYSREVFASLMSQVDAFVKHLLCHRAVQCNGGALLQLPFWSLTSNAHLCQAVVSWCKVFGASGKNTEVHWHKLSTDEAETFKEGFRGALSKNLGLCPDAWRKYCKEVKDFRDKYVAHTEIGFSEPVPNLDIALDVAFLFDRWVRDVIAPDVIEDRPLSELAAQLSENFESHIESLSRWDRDQLHN